MFCGLNGATDIPRLTQARAIPATSMDFPTFEPAPWIMIALVIASPCARCLGVQCRQGKIMNSSANLNCGTAAFGNPDKPAVMVAAVAGEIVAYLLLGWNRWSPHVVFGRMFGA